MKTTIALLAVMTLFVGPVLAQRGFGDDLIGHLAGEWVMTGTIAGGEVVHDLEAAWVLDGFYLQFHELARERTEDGKPAYEAIVTIGWDEPSKRYVCLWLDSTGGTGLASGILGYGKREGDSIPFVFGEGNGSAIHNTFQYQRDSDTWQWVIDNVNGDETSNFAEVTLKRR